MWNFNRNLVAGSDLAQEASEKIAVFVKRHYEIKKCIRKTCDMIFYL